MEPNDEIAPVEPVATLEPEQPKKAKGTKSKKAATPDCALTLADLSEKYLAHMDREGKSSGTIASYGMELKSAQAELGAETRVADLTPDKVNEFFNCARVTKLRGGKKAKSQLSVDKTRRVLRLALVWAVEKKLLERAPLPVSPVETQA